MNYEHDHDIDQDGELDGLRAEVRAARVYREQLARHPDCRDPDHPGCSNCIATDE